MAAARGGARPRGGRGGRGGGDAFGASLREALADALDVASDRIEVRVTVDGEVVDGQEVAGLELRSVAPVASESEHEEAPEREADAEPDTRARGGDRDRGGSAGPGGRGGRDGRDGRDGRGDRSEARDRDGRGDGDESGRSDQEPPVITPEELDEEAEAAADLLEGLLDAMDLPGDLRIQLHEAHAEVEIVGAGEGVLIGRRGQTLEAVQDLIRTAMQRRFERRSRVLVDVDGYRARRLEKLIERAEEAVQQVLETGESQRLEPMDSIERRLIHQRVAAHEGVVSRSHGREPARRIEIELADEDD